MTYLKTERLVLRAWRDEDLEPFAAMNADNQVMEFYPATLSRRESDGFAARCQERLSKNGFGLYAAEIKTTGAFIGYVGFAAADFLAPFTPAIEVGWRLAHFAWGHGYASEAAKACLAHGFSRLGFEEVVSFTATGNTRSIAVMERIGMSRNPADDFDHPNLPDGHPLSRHVLYRAPGSASY